MKKRELKKRIAGLERQVADLDREVELLGKLAAWLEEQQRAPDWIVPCVPLESVYPARHVPPACRRWYPDWTWYPTITCTTNVVEGGVW